MTTDSVTIAGAGSLNRTAYLDLPVGPPPGVTALLIGGLEKSAAVRVSRHLRQQGIAVLRLPLFGGEGGERAPLELQDVRQAAAYLEEAIEAPALLVGHSFGGTLAARAGAHLEEVTVATIGAPADASSVDRICRSVGSSASERLLDALDGGHVEDAVRRLDELCVLHSPADEVVSIENASRLFGWAAHPKHFISLNQADHWLTSTSDVDNLAALLGAWVQKHLGANSEENGQERAVKEQVAVRTGRDRFYTDVWARRHYFAADEPVKAGGTGAGPSPYDLLAVALGACTSMTLRMYADRKDWPLEEVAVYLYHEKVHAKDCADCETHVGKIDRIDREIELKGALSDEQKARLVEIANKCPVHRTLIRENEVRTRLRPSGGNKERT